MFIDLIHYLIVGATIIISSLCVGIGQGKAAVAFSQATNEQPAAHQNLQFLFILGTAMLEFISILGCLMTALFLMKTTTTSSMVLAQAGAACAFIIPAGIVGVASAYPLKEIFLSLARQPLFQQKLLSQMLLTQIMLQTSVLFGFVISIILHTQTTEFFDTATGLKLLASGLVFGLGTIGPIIGLTLFATQACKSVGLNRHAFDKIFSFSFISQGMIETPVLLVFVIAIIFGFIPTSTAPYASIAYLASAFCMGMTNLGAGINSGRTASHACEQIGMHIEKYETLSTISLISQTFIESNAIYGLIIVILMVFGLA